MPFNNNAVGSHTRCRLSRATLAIVAVMATLVVASPALAGCNVTGCWGKVIEVTIVAQNGRIWLVTNRQEELGNLSPANGCVVGQVWAQGAVQNALYISESDPDRSEKYTLVVLALQSGAKVGFNTVLDPATGLCALGDINVDVTA